MKKTKYILINVFLLFILFTSLCFGAWDKDKPSASTSLANSNPEILANYAALEVAIGQDHTFTTGNPDGKHKQVTFTDPISTPGNVANEGVVYIKDVAAVVELHFKDESGNEIQMSSGGSMGSATTALLANTATFSGAIAANGSITLGAGDDLLLSTTSDITISGNTFTVAGATGNTIIAGTLGVTGIATLGDGSLATTQTASDGSTKLATTAYVDSATSKAMKVFTRDMTAASGDVSYTGIGFIPTFITIVAGAEGSAAASWGAYDGTTQNCIRQIPVTDASGLAHMEQAATIIHLKPSTAANQQTAIVKTFDADGFTLTWTKTGTPTGTANLMAICYRE